MDKSFEPEILEVADRLFPSIGRQRLETLEDLDPEYAKLFGDYVHKGLLSRSVIDHKTRELCAVAVLTATSINRQLAIHIAAALRAGASEAEIREVIFQTTIYSGMPSMLNALEVMRLVLENPQAAAEGKVCTTP